MASRRTRQLVSLALAALLSFGVGTEAYGWHDCPHHHPEEDPAPAATERPASRPLAQSPGETSTSPEGPCVCVGSCHAGATAPLPATPAPSSSIPHARYLPTTPATSSTLPRLPAPYFLPYPNGPPGPDPGAHRA